MRVAWQEPPARLRPAPELLELALRPSVRLRAVRRMFVCLIALYVVELALRHHPGAAAATVVIAGCGMWPARRRAPRCLRFEPDGSLLVQSHAGRWEQVQLSPASLLLGRHMLLVLRGNRRVLRLLLGPDNLAPDHLAALRRRLRVGPGTATSGVHSVAAPGSHPTELP